MRTTLTNISKIDKFRIAMIILIVLLLLPTVIAGATHTELSSSEDNSSLTNVDEVTFVTAQGKEGSANEARLVAFDQNGTPIRVHSRYSKYYDVDPLSGDRILLVVGAEGVKDVKHSGKFVAVEMNWKTGKVYRQFVVPKDTHDVDYIGNDKYAVVEKVKTSPPSKSNKAYVYDYARNKRVWQYNFTDHFPPYPKAGGKETGYTHVNDIDVVNNGSAFLVSPRNYDRVMLINRSTKEVEWTLGEENNYTILNEQHNPQLVSQDPRTVLVADSENDRVVEYRQNETGWHLDWSYSNLSWPRDADRLPNGNTLIADSSGNRALEITPQGETVWQVNISYSPYDVERLSLGDEAGGPTIMEQDARGNYSSSDTETDTPPGTVMRVLDSFEFWYTTAQWVVPTWIGKLEFAFLSAVPLAGIVWASIELARVWPSHLIERQKQRFSRQQRGVATIVGVACIFEAMVLLVISIAPNPYTTLMIGIGILALTEGTSAVHTVFSAGSDGRFENVFRLFHEALRIAAVLSAAVLVYIALTAGETFFELYLAIAFLLVLSAVRLQSHER